MMIPIHQFLKSGGEVVIGPSISHLVADLKNVRCSLYINPDDLEGGEGQQSTNTVYVYLNHDDPMSGIDYILREMRADEMSIVQFADDSFVRMCWN